MLIRSQHADNSVYRVFTSHNTSDVWLADIGNPI